MVTKVVAPIWLGHFHPQNVLWGQARTWGLHNCRNNKFDLIGHHLNLITTIGLSVISPISPNNKDMH
jgi:hypothetical protein